MNNREILSNFTLKHEKMNNQTQSVLTLSAIQAAIFAGRKILEIYNTGFTTSYKADQSPLTTADLAANEIIVNRLLESGFPILSEEGKNTDYQERREWHYFWLIDPLDGTKEFINHNGEFTVNIALVAGNTPAIGVIYVPVTGDLYFGNPEAGSYSATIADTIDPNGFRALEEVIASAQRLPLTQSDQIVTILASRSHMSAETEEIIEKIKTLYPDPEIINAGSSLKFCRLAEGKAQIYPRFGPTMEWDTAAGHAIAANAGIKVLSWNERQPLEYNKEDLVNPWFIAFNQIFNEFV